jgi:hypothetical protein
VLLARHKAIEHRLEQHLVSLFLGVKTAEQWAQFIGQYLTFIYAAG